MLRLSAKEKILILLHDHINEQISSKPMLTFSQSGMEEEANISHRLVSEGLKLLKKEGLVEEKRFHLIETGRFRSFYFLTSDGIVKAKELKKEIDEKTLNVREKNKVWEMKIGRVIDYLKKKSKGKIEINYTNVLKHILPDDFLDLEDVLEIKKEVDFSERKPEVRYFVGREKELKEISNFIESGAGILVLKGIAGIGKTAVVSKALEQYKGNVFWHRFYPFSTLEGMLTKLSRFLSKIGKEKMRNYMGIGEVKIEEIMIILEEETNESMLLVFDNFENANKKIVDFFFSFKELKTGSKSILMGRSIPSFYSRKDAVVKKNVVEIKLKELDKRSSENLLIHRGIKKDLDKLYNLTKGHPLMLELILPETAIEAEEFLRDEIFKRLNEPERKALEIASVFRYPFYPRALLVEDIDYDTIDSLTEKSLLQRLDNIYDIHEILRDFCYSRLNLKHKKYYHSIAAEYYENEKGEDARIEYMHHLLKAGNNEKAGETAVENGFSIIKSGYAEGFMHILKELDEKQFQKQRLPMLLLKGKASEVMGKWDDSLRYYKILLELTAGNEKDAVEAHLGIARICFPRGKYDEALKNLNQALKISKKINDVHGAADAYYGMGSVHLRKGKIDDAINDFKLCLDFCQKTGDISLMIKTYRTMGVAYWSKGMYDKSTEIMMKALDAAEKTGDKHEIAKIYNNIGAVYDRKKDIDKSIEWYEKCIKISSEIGDVRMTCYGMSNAAEGYTRKDMLEKAMDYTDKALKIFECLDEKRMLTQCHLTYLSNETYFPVNNL
jgi:tetratricopeptide (TPR) repeat protein